MSSAQHKALLVESKGSPLVLKSTPTPQPGKGQLLVKIHATSLNPIDLGQVVMGFLVQSYPFIGGFDGAGVVEAVGEGVTSFAKGDKVYVLLSASPGLRLISDHGCQQLLRSRY